MWTVRGLGPLQLLADRPPWAARVGINHRALALSVPEGYVWVWIGHHAVYDRLIK